MSCGELGKGAKTEHTPEPTDIHSPFNACMYRWHCNGLEKQRDELLAAQQELLDALDHQISDPDRLFRAKKTSRAVIASVKGSAA